MSNARKLQTEIDRVLKKVDEGVELFDDIWEKVYTAEQQSQKEKHEQDLKKEIKKLQRLRDQIKTWIGSSEVKDKDALLESRRLIETKMEQFKVCEKETKTKTYSKEGLAREEKLDPMEEAKRTTAGWITDYIERLRQLVQDREVEIERLQAGKGKKSNKLIIDEYQTFLLNHKFHVSKLEGIMRLVNNDRLDPELVDNIKDDLDYYMESYEEDEYQQAYDENFFYESLGLDELDVVVVDRVTVVPPAVKKASNDDSGSQASSNMSNSKDASNHKKNSSKKAAGAIVIPLTIGRARVTSAGEVKPGTGIPTTIGGPPGSLTPPSVISTTTAPALQATTSASATSSPTILPTGGGLSATTTPTKLGRASTTGGALPANTASVLAAPTSLAPAASATTVGRTTPTPNATGGASMAAILKRESEQQEKERQKALQQQLQQQQQMLREQQARTAQAAEQLRQQQQQQQQQLQRQQQEQQQQLQRQQQEALRQQQAAAAAAQQEALQRQQQQQQEQALRQQQQDAAAKQQAQLQQQVAEKLQQQQQQPRSQAVGLDILSSGFGGLSLGNTEREATNVPGVSAVNPNVPPPLAASAPAPTAVTGTSLGTSGSYDAASSYLAALNESLATIPNATDSERSRPYTPSNPYPTPACYPSLPSTMFENPAVFEKLGTDCLFFIFYYAQGTYQQYLAARELKKQSWRFHKKFMTWFQRHEEPKVTTDEYEQGTYVYFDYESGWCTRIKADFRFEYVYLEDSLQ